jgi:hypothetical protein
LPRKSVQIILRNRFVLRQKDMILVT